MPSGKPPIDLPSGYELRQRLGKGAYGEVWRAEAPGGVEVAIKIIARTVKEDEAERELKALHYIRRLRHQNLLSLQAFYAQEEHLIVVMELADRSLRDRLNQCQQAGFPGIPQAELNRYMKEAAEALDYLHDHQVQHRDIKPDNILLLGQHAKVADCGLARLLEEHSLQSATVIGTPAYMASEVWAGKTSVHSDQYSLAMTYAELRLGKMPYRYSNLAHLVQMHLNEAPDLAGLGEHERGVLLRGLAKDPRQRFATCAAFLVAMEEACAASVCAIPAAAGSAVPAIQFAPPEAPAQEEFRLPSDNPLPSTLADAASESATAVEPAWKKQGDRQHGRELRRRSGQRVLLRLSLFVGGPLLLIAVVAWLALYFQSRREPRVGDKSEPKYMFKSIFGRGDITYEQYLQEKREDDLKAREQNKANLKLLGIALSNYHDANLRFPPSAVRGKDGKPLYSWRVAILSYLGDDAAQLSLRFHLDESWDSPHNIKLLEAMPKVYAPVRKVYDAPVSLGLTKPGWTFYQGFVGPHAMFEDRGSRGIRMADVIDGTSNTLLLVEAGEAVPWSKPADLTYTAPKNPILEPKGPLPKLGGLFPDGFNGLLVDGRVQFFDKSIAESTLHRLIMRDDGQLLPAGIIQP